MEEHKGGGIVSQGTKEIRLRPRAWCIRIPRTYCGDLGHKNIGGFQTVVIAYDQRNAWESAMGSPDWEMLFFPVENISVFPTQPV